MTLLPSSRQLFATREPRPDMSLPEIPDTSTEIPEDFILLVRDALVHLYDLAHLQRHALARLVADSGGPLQDAARALRTLLLDSLEQINPGSSVSRNDKEWRPYGILTHRYVDGFTIEEIMAELGISLRQFQRDHRKGLLAVAAILWRRWQREGEAAGSAALDATRQGLEQEVVRLGLALEAVGLGDLVEAILQPARALAQGCSVRLETGPPRRAVSARADPMLAKQALLGALSALITARPARISLAWRNARGIALLELDLHPPLPADSSSRGELGNRLAAAEELMRAQGGNLEMVSDDASLRAVRLSFRMAPGRHALLIDDNASLLQLFERYLIAGGFRVTSAADASAAMQAIEQERPQVILLDVMMRNVDGWQLLQRLRADPSLQDVPIVVCSVLNEPELARALGAQYYLKKPVSPQQLLAALQEVLGGNSPAGPPPAAR